jgi:hypothetical protein
MPPKSMEFIIFLHFLEYTKAFSYETSVYMRDFRYVTSVYMWDFRHVNSVCMHSAYLSGHIHNTKKVFFERNSNKKG